MNDKDRRGSGRTTRMLQLAHAEAQSGKAVIVVVSRRAELRYMFNILHGMGVDEWQVSRSRAQIGVGSVEFVSADHPLFDRELWRVRGFDGPIFVDHHAQEVAEADECSRV